MRLCLLTLLLIASAFGQQKAHSSDGGQEPVRVERVPPPEAGSAEETPNHRRQRLAREATGVPSPEDYKFGEALNVLTATPTGSTSAVPSAAAARRPSSSTKASHKEASVPKQAESTPALADKPLSPTATEAVNLSAQWRDSRNSPTEGPDGVVRFTYGAGLPILVCAPLRVCMIELQAGEKVTSEPQIGDSVRWSVTPTTSGTGEQIIPLLVVKPKSAGLDTNLFIPTDRHNYYIRLVSNQSDYVARLAFAYPQDDGKESWKAYMAQHPPETPKPESESDLPGLNVENLYTDYRIKGNDPYIRPVRVVDDGAKTYIQMPPAFAHRESPVLAVIGKDSQAEIVNYRVHGLTFIVDRLFDRAALILGAGKTASRTEIVRGSWKKKGFFLFAKDPYKDVSPEKEAQQ